MGCCSALARLVFFLVTFSLWVMGIVGVSFGVYFIFRYDFLQDTADNYTLSAVSKAVIALAVVLLVLGFLGCCGVWCGNKCLLYLFGTVLTFLLIGEFALSIYCLMEKQNIHDEVISGLHKTAEDYLTDKSTIKAWDEMQKRLECCGIENGPGDWAEYISPGFFPISCCAGTACSSQDVACPSENEAVVEEARCVPVTGLPDSFTEGCAAKINQSLKDNFTVLAVTGICFAFLQLLGVMAAYHLGYSMAAKGEELA